MVTHTPLIPPVSRCGTSGWAPGPLQLLPSQWVTSVPSVIASTTFGAVSQTPRRIPASSGEITAQLVPSQCIAIGAPLWAPTIHTSLDALPETPFRSMMLLIGSGIGVQIVPSQWTIMSVCAAAQTSVELDPQTP